MYLIKIMKAYCINCYHNTSYSEAVGFTNRNRFNYVVCKRCRYSPYLKSIVRKYAVFLYYRRLPRIK